VRTLQRGVVGFEGPVGAFAGAVLELERWAIGFAFLVAELAGLEGGQICRNPQLTDAGSAFSTISARSRNCILQGQPPFLTASVHAL